MAPRKIQAFSPNLLVRKFSTNGRFPQGCTTPKVAETLFTETLPIKKLYEKAHISRDMENHSSRTSLGSY